MFCIGCHESVNATTTDEHRYLLYRLINVKYKILYKKIDVIWVNKTWLLIFITVYELKIENCVGAKPNLYKK